MAKRGPRAMALPTASDDVPPVAAISETSRSGSTSRSAAEIIATEAGIIAARTAEHTAFVDARRSLVGQRVQLIGFRGRRQRLNGHVGSVWAYKDDRDQYNVRLCGRDSTPASHERFTPRADSTKLVVASPDQLRPLSYAACALLDSCAHDAVSLLLDPPANRQRMDGPAESMNELTVLARDHVVFHGFVRVPSAAAPGETTRAFAFAAYPIDRDRDGYMGYMDMAAKRAKAAEEAVAVEGIGIGQTPTGQLASRDGLTLSANMDRGMRAMGRFHICTDPAYTREACDGDGFAHQGRSGGGSGWHVRLQREQANMFTLYDGSDDHFGLRSGVPSRELAHIALDTSAAAAQNPPSSSGGYQVGLSVSIPRVRRDGAAAQIHPANTDETIRACLERLDFTNIMVLRGAAHHAHASGSCLELACDELGPPHAARCLEAHRRSSGLWRVRYAYPISPCVAFAIITALLHHGPTAVIDTLPMPPAINVPAAVSLDAQERELRALAAEVRAALARPGELRTVHAAMYEPYALAVINELVTSVLVTSPLATTLAHEQRGQADGRAAFSDALRDALTKAGLGSGGRHARCVAWADEHGVTTLAQMLSLLALQPALWKGMLAAVAPTKAFHKNRLHTQLKRLAEGGAMPTAARREATDGYWGAIDAEIRSDACGVDGAAAPDATRMAAARAAVDPAPPSPVTLPMAVIVRRSR